MKLTSVICAASGCDFSASSSPTLSLGRLVRKGNTFSATQAATCSSVIRCSLPSEFWERSKQFHFLSFSSLKRKIIYIWERKIDYTTKTCEWVKQPESS